MKLWLERRFGTAIVLIWLIASLLLIFMARDAITHWRFGDPDDQLRIVQVRDWLAGQSWWDITQYRMNPPHGGAMHWSRLVDIPLAAAILFFGLFMSQSSAEMWASVVVPLLALGASLWIFAKLGKRLFGAFSGLMAALLMVTYFPVMMQLVPMRIDHHGWQIFLFGVIAYKLFDRDAPLRSGTIIGLASALWIEISIEGLPFAAVLIAPLAFRWIVAVVQYGDNNAERKFVGALIGLAFGSAFLFSITENWQTHGTKCDSLSPVHVYTFGAIALCVLAAIFGMKALRSERGWAVKIGICAIAGAAGLSVLFVIAPQCAGDAFSGLDPLVRDYWFKRVPEGLPLWATEYAFSGQAWFSYAAGAIGGVALLIFKKPEARDDQMQLLFLFIACALIGLLVSRTALYTLLLTNLILASLFLELMKRADTLSNIGWRMGLRVVALTIAMPAVVAQNAIDYALAQQLDADPKLKAEDKEFDDLTRQCQKASATRALQQLPHHSQLMIGLDTGPAVLVFTDLKIVASGHHRNQVAMADVIRAFIGSEADARKIYKARGIDYLVTCEGSYELQIYYSRAPNGFGSQVRRGDLPRWLVKDRAIGPFSVYRVDWAHEGLR
jgi:hypothetical protein